MTAWEFDRPGDHLPRPCLGCEPLGGDLAARVQPWKPPGAAQGMRSGLSSPALGLVAVSACLDEITVARTSVVDRQSTEDEPSTSDNVRSGRPGPNQHGQLGRLRPMRRQRLRSVVRPGHKRSAVDRGWLVLRARQWHAGRWLCRRTASGAGIPPRRVGELALKRAGAGVRVEHRMR